MSRRIHRTLLIEELESRVSPAVLTSGQSVSFTDGDNDVVRLLFTGDGTATVTWAIGGANPVLNDEVQTVVLAGTTIRSGYTATIVTRGSATPTLTGGAITSGANPMGRISMTATGGTVVNTDIAIGGDATMIMMTGILDNSANVGWGVTVGGTTGSIMLRNGMNEAAINVGNTRMIQILGNVITANAITPITTNNIDNLIIKGLVSNFDGGAVGVPLIDINGNAGIVQLLGGTRTWSVLGADIDIEGNCRLLDLRRYALATDIEIGGLTPADRASRITIWREFADWETGAVSSSLTVNGTTGALTFKTDPAAIGLYRTNVTLNGNVDSISLFSRIQDSTITVNGDLGTVRRGAVTSGSAEQNTSLFFTMTVNGNLLRGGDLPYLFGTGSSFTVNGNVQAGNLRIYRIDGATVNVTGNVSSLAIYSTAKTADVTIGGNVTGWIMAVAGLDSVNFTVGGAPGTGFLSRFTVLGSMKSSSLTTTDTVDNINILGSLESTLLSIGNDLNRLLITGSMTSSGINVTNNARRIAILGSLEGIYPGLGAYDAMFYDGGTGVETNWSSTALPITENRTSIFVDSSGNEYMVFQRREATNEDWEIWYEINDGGPIRLTNNDRDDIFPSIYVDDSGGPGFEVIHIIWQWQQDTDPGDWEIVYWNSNLPYALPLTNLDNASLVAVSTALGTGNDVEDRYPMIDQSSTPTSIGFTWQQEDATSGDTFYICYSTINPTLPAWPLPVTQVLNAASGIEGETPAINGGRIAYVLNDGEDYEVYYWRSGAITQVTNNAVDDLNPAIYWNPLALPVQSAYIAWEQYEDTDHDPAPQPYISGGEEIEGSPEIMFWNSGTGVTSAVTNSPADEYNLEPSVWVDPNTFTAGVAYQHRHAVGDSYNYDIYYWVDGVPGVDQITTNLSDDITPWLFSDGVDFFIGFSWYDGIPAPTLTVGIDLDYMSVGGDMTNVDCAVGNDLDQLRVGGALSDEDAAFDWIIGNNARYIHLGYAKGTAGNWTDQFSMQIVNNLTERVYLTGTFAKDTSDIHQPDPLAPITDYPYLLITGTAAGSLIYAGRDMAGYMVVGGRFGDATVGRIFNGQLLAGAMGIGNTFKAFDSPEGLILPGNAFQNYKGYP
ncbi:MAG: hypothetical protein AB1696_00840 [Planctomycetota bacterium]